MFCLAVTYFYYFMIFYLLKKLCSFKNLMGTLKRVFTAAFWLSSAPEKELNFNSSHLFN